MRIKMCTPIHKMKGSYIFFLLSFAALQSFYSANAITAEQICSHLVRMKPKDPPHFTNQTFESSCLKIIKPIPPQKLNDAMEFVASVRRVLKDRIRDVAGNFHDILQRGGLPEYVQQEMDYCYAMYSREIQEQEDYLPGAAVVRAKGLPPEQLQVDGLPETLKFAKELLEQCRDKLVHATKSFPAKANDDALVVLHVFLYALQELERSKKAAMKVFSDKVK